MRKVFLDHLPRRGKLIDWKNSIGYKVSFVYEDVEGEVTIIDYQNGALTIKYNDKSFPIRTGNFSKCVLGTLLGKYSFTSDFKYAVGEVIEDINYGRFKILEQLRLEHGIKKRSKSRYYSYLCLICGHKDIAHEQSIKRGSGCPVCCNKQVIKGFNDIWTISPSFSELLWNPEDGYKYTIGSKQKVDFKCPECGERIKNKEIYSIKDQGLSCYKCSDGISFPNKIMYNVLSQLAIDFEAEWRPKWSNGKRYDFYIPSIKCAVEMHGEQHYINSFVNLDSRTLEEEQENDRVKEEILKSKNIAYLPIDAKLSNFDYIKSNILSSQIAEYFNLNKIDWEKCHKDSLRSLVIQACNIFKNENLTTTEIGERLSLTRTTIIRYLKKGTKFGWCNYDPQEEARKGRVKANKISAEKSKKVVLQFSLEGEPLHIFKSVKEAGETLGILPRDISATCLGKQKSAGGFMWQYQHDYDTSKTLKYEKGKKVASVVRMSLCGEYIDEFGSIKEATDKLNIGQSCISSVCANKQKTAGGYKWMYKEDYIKNHI